MFATFNIVLNSMITLSICMAMGYFFRKKKIISDEVLRGLSSLLIKLIMPCLVIISMQKDFSAELLSDSLLMLVVGFIFHLTGTAIGLVLTKIIKVAPNDRGIILFALTFPNIVYMGLPVITSVYGDETIFYISMGNIAFNTLAFTLGIKLVSGRKEKSAISYKEILFNVPIIATALGFVMFVTSFKIWPPLNEAISITGKMTVPLSMLIVGSCLADSDLREVFKGKQIYLFTFIRLIFIPLLMLFILRPFIKNELILAPIVLMSAMPPASLTAILAANYDGNTYLASKYIFINTLLSIFTIPLITLLIEVLKTV